MKRSLGTCCWPRRILHVELPYDAVPVVADKDRISQVVCNYVTNALKYSSDEHPVEVRLEAAHGEARVEVAITALASIQRIRDMYGSASTVSTGTTARALRGWESGISAANSSNRWAGKWGSTAYLVKARRSGSRYRSPRLRTSVGRQRSVLPFPGGGGRTLHVRFPKYVDTHSSAIMQFYRMPYSVLGRACRSLKAPANGGKFAVAFHATACRPHDAAWCPS